MAEFPYMTNPARVKDLLAHIQSAGIPNKVTNAYLATTGFKSSNDRRLIGIFKSLGFLDSSGAPTELWKKYRNKTEAPVVLASAIRTTYASLFDLYPDAQLKDQEALRNFFSGQTSVGKDALSFMVATFRTLCESANFGVSASAQAETALATSPAPAPASVPAPALALPSGVPAVNINIQLELPATDDAEIYDKLFASMKKHLFPS